MAEEELEADAAVAAVVGITAAPIAAIATARAADLMVRRWLFTMS
jgi:hypothetical protein